MTFATTVRFLLSALLVGTSTVAIAECVGLRQLQDAAKPQPPGVTAFFKTFFDRNPPCSAAKVIFKEMTKERKPADFRLQVEERKDAQREQADLEKALAKPAVRQLLEDAKRDNDDENVRLGFEAAILFDQGFFGASSLKTRLLRERLQ